MTTGLLVSAIVNRLQAAGYHSLSTPFKVASVRFDFTAVLQGLDGRAFDLVLIIDTSVAEGTGEDVRRRIEALSRALDISRSHLVLTAVLAGAPLSRSELEAISRICRVLIIEGLELSSGAPASETVALELEDRLRVLLPLKIDGGTTDIADPIGVVWQTLPSAVDRQQADVFLSASARGEKAVLRALSDMLTRALAPGVPS